MGEHNLEDDHSQPNCIRKGQIHERKDKFTNGQIHEWTNSRMDKFTNGQIHENTKSRKANLRSGATMAVSVLFPGDVKGRVQLGEDSVSEPQQICGEFRSNVVDIVVGFR